MSGHYWKNMVDVGEPHSLNLDPRTPTFLWVIFNSRGYAFFSHESEWLQARN